MQTEESYVDQLVKLKASVKADTIPDDVKGDVLRTIARLETLLWPYSY